MVRCFCSLQVYISGHALVILGGPHTLLQTIYVDDTESLEAVTIDEASGKIAVCGGPDIFIYQPYGIKHETLKVRYYEDGSGELDIHSPVAVRGSAGANANCLSV